jgi:hypothetical protein
MSELLRLDVARKKSEYEFRKERMTRPLTEDSKPHAWFAAHNISDFIATEPFRDPAVMDRPPFRGWRAAAPRHCLTDSANVVGVKVRFLDPRKLGVN